MKNKIQVLSVIEYGLPLNTENKFKLSKEHFVKSEKSSRRSSK